MTVVVCSASCHVLIAASPPHLSTPALAVAVAAARSLNYEKRQSRVYAMALQDATVEVSTEALRDAVLVSSPWLYKIRQCKGALHILCIVGKGGLADL